jgi:Ni/Fe-hydrogenase 1 B-type cytochrome subunit
VKQLNQEEEKAAQAEPAENLQRYYVWDRGVRWFHWINVITVLGLIAVGTVILNATSLGVSSEGKVDLKILHAWIGYAFALNLLWRIIWGFIGSPYARWSAILPGGTGYVGRLKEWLHGAKAGKAPAYKGHNPAARLMLALLFFVLATQMVTGLVLAGTDLYFPPFGHEFAEWATAAGEDHSKLEGLVPGAKEMLDPEGYAAMRRFRAPFIEIHEIGFWVMLVAIFGHIAAVVISEVKERDGLISAMFSGYKVFGRKPKD